MVAESLPLSPSFHDHDREISYRVHTPPRAYAVASPGRFHAAQTQPAASLRLPSQPAWNDARDEILA